MTKKSAEDLICVGCGAKLQSDDPNRSGYVPQSTLENRQEAEIYCKRCFRLRHYNEIQDVELTNHDFMAMMNELSSKRSLIVYVVDLFDVTGTMISGIQRFAGQNPLLVVGNKKDLLPHSQKTGKMRQWLLERMHEWGVRPVGCQLVSAHQSETVKQLMATIETLRKGRDVYVVGATNVGKSTLINQMINITTEDRHVITTSYFPGTTLGKIMIPLDESSHLIDTPGIILKTNYTNYLTPQELKVTVPQKEIKPKNYPMIVGQTLFLGGLARIDYTSGKDQQHFISYTSKELTIHRTKTKKAASLYEKQVGKLLQPPFSREELLAGEWIEKQLTIQEPADLVIAGLGWVHIDQGDAKVSVWVPQAVEVSIRKPMIG